MAGGWGRYIYMSCQLPGSSVSPPPLRTLQVIATRRSSAGAFIVSLNMSLPSLLSAVRRSWLVRQIRHTDVKWLVLLGCQDPQLLCTPIICPPHFLNTTLSLQHFVSILLGRQTLHPEHIKHQSSSMVKFTNKIIPRLF